jgi:hypothetical protein
MSETTPLSFNGNPYDVSSVDLCDLVNLCGKFVWFNNQPMVCSNLNSEYRLGGKGCNIFAKFEVLTTKQMGRDILNLDFILGRSRPRKPH